MSFVAGAVSRAITNLVGPRHVVGPVWSRRLARRRLRQLHDDGTKSARTTSRRITSFRIKTPRIKTPWPIRRPSPVVDNDERLADVLDAVGRELRLGASLHAALIAAIERNAASEWEWLCDAARGGHDLHEAITQRIAAQGDDFSLRVIAAAADGGDAVHAVESAARTLRTNAAISADARTAVAHTSSSIRVLTWVPVVIALWLVWRDIDARTFYLSRAGMVCVTAGALLQFVGRRTSMPNSPTSSIWCRCTCARVSPQHSRFFTRATRRPATRAMLHDRWPMLFATERDLSTRLSRPAHGSGCAPRR